MPQLSTTTIPPRDQITALLLAGGRATRMGGLDKGLQTVAGVALVAHIAQRIESQVGNVWISANRHLSDYANYGARVLPDLTEGFAGPLAAWQTALQSCETPWILSLPCDNLDFPDDLCQRLATAITSSTQLSYACAYDGTELRHHPVFALIHRRYLPALNAYLSTGQRRVFTWLQTMQAHAVLFDDNTRFENINTLEQLQQKNLSYATRQHIK